jgi:UDP-N-acetyl-D-mannosaminuronic acid dehydrogenase
VRLLDRELAEVSVHDPHVATSTMSLAEAVRGADAVVIATNHAAFRTPEALGAIAAGASEDCLIADPWDCWGSGQLFAYAGELLAGAGEPQ